MTREMSTDVKVWRTSAILGVGAAVTIGLLGAASAVAQAPQQVGPCPPGYRPYDVRVYGQRLEEPNPRPGADHSQPTLVQNNWEYDTADDPRFVVITACVRPLTDAENKEIFRWGSQNLSSPK